MNYNINNICTSPEQSKKLIELGIDIKTADMRYGYIAPYDYSDRMYDGGYDEIPYPKDFLKKNPNFSENEYDGELPAWSIAALLEQLEDTAGLAKDYGLWFCYDNRKSYCTKHYDNPIDACVEMIIKLKEKGLI